MNIPIWLLAIGVPCIAMIGFFACAVLTAGKVADQAIDSDELGEAYYNAVTAHSRATDALQAKTDRIERALAQVTDGANATVKRMARILSGDA